MKTEDRWLCISSLPMAGKCCMVFQGSLSKTSLPEQLQIKTYVKRSTGVTVVGGSSSTWIIIFQLFRAAWGSWEITSNLYSIQLDIP
uniref:Uncharacterized protein n=1 Tax=Seriola dumerili TaxID=41447 RepID=A0A3B4U637_SERDU